MVPLLQKVQNWPLWPLLEMKLVNNNNNNNNNNNDLLTDPLGGSSLLNYIDYNYKIN